MNLGSTFSYAVAALMALCLLMAWLRIRIHVHPNPIVLSGLSAEYYYDSAKKHYSWMRFAGFRKIGLLRVNVDRPMWLQFFDPSHTGSPNQPPLVDLHWKFDLRDSHLFYAKLCQKVFLKTRGTL